MEEKPLILDNGAFKLKAGFAGEAKPRLVMENCVFKTRKHGKRIYVGDQFDRIEAYNSIKLRRPHTRGFMANRYLESSIWNHVFMQLKIDPSGHRLALTEPMLNTTSNRDQMNELIFETFGFQSVRRERTPVAILHGYRPPKPKANAPGFDKRACVVIDSGFSFTHVVPLLFGKIHTPGVRKIEIGGMHLTNKLKEVVSFRQMDISEDQHLAEHMKTSLCYTAKDFLAELRKCRSRKSTTRRKYLLPAQDTHAFGVVHDGVGELSKDQQYIVMNNERLVIPEMLFNPNYYTDVDQGGIHEATKGAIQTLPDDEKAVAWSNVLLAGGSVQFPNFQERLETELRAEAPQHLPVRVFSDKSPDLLAWRGLSALSCSASYLSESMTRAQYLESGTATKRRKRGR